MRSAAAIIGIFLPAVTPLTPFVGSSSSTGTTGPAMTLSALPNSSNNNAWGSRGVPSQTARESAVNVEWEPMTELERRIEDGVNYEHIPNFSSHGRPPNPRNSSKENSEDDLPSTRGVFIGYRYTDDEYNRLKSADPLQ